MLTTFEDWVQWKERCAIALCDDNTRDCLERFVQGQFRAFARKVEGARPDLKDRFRELTEDSATARRNCAHLFDAYMTPPGKAALRKPYKDAIMAARPLNAKDPKNPTKEEHAAAWAGYAKRCVRTIFRDFVQKEIEGSGESRPLVPFDVPADSTKGETSVTPSTRIFAKDRGPEDQVKLNEIYRVVDGLILDAKERLVLWADADNINRTGRTVTELAGVGRSQISAAARNLEKSIVKAVAGHFSVLEPTREVQKSKFYDVLEACWDRLVLKHRNLTPERQPDGRLLWIESPPTGAPPSRPA